MKSKQTGIHLSSVRRRRGATLIDVAVGSMLMALLLVPSVNLMSQSHDNAHRLRVRQTLLDAAEQRLEVNRLLLSNPTTFASAENNPSDQLQRISTSVGSALARVQIASDDTLVPSGLLNLTVDVWLDDNNNLILDPAEPSTRLRTQWAAP